MRPLKSKIRTKSFNKLTKTQDITNTIERLFTNSQDSIIVFNQHGKIVAINEKAAALFNKNPDKLINKPIWKLFKLNSFTIKRQFIQAKRCFLLAHEGIAQQFTWLESKAQKPVLAYHILFNKAEIEDTPVIFTKLTDILKSKTIEWILWSLTKISNHQEVNEIIDQILQLISDVFAADYTSVSFVNNQQIARTISYYKFGKKEENISFSLINTPCAEVIRKKTICYFNDVQEKFPKDKLLKKMKINTYLAGPITNPQDEVIGIMTILSRSKIILDISERMIALHFIQISKKLKQIHHIGINISLDNFCCPQISLPELLSLPLDYLKVDQRLLIGIEGKVKLRKLLSGIINLTQDLNIKIIQKGIETAEQHEVIKSIGCQYAQGYFYCKPVALNELLPLIKKLSTK
ncbi:TPA: EAL domain-containing protein [Legionella pneumophila]|nr:EAL domain-containing protein [Legionella pneumophila subsp. fraseri]HAT1771456.1 EAL domain-containing protein [Legionella pneumophila]MDX1845868.1 EAL domain-containing protein [Legionella pneumophila subsp. fraseri]HAT2135364.1 EAL domain-containing protein [Legionella pneumophila]HAT2141483.1 EAL domain-containing protein [Legionella pneumophila]